MKSNTSNHEILGQCRFDGRPASQTVGQQCTIFGWEYCVCCAGQSVDCLKTTRGCQQNKRQWCNADLMLGHGRRGWPSIETALDPCRFWHCQNADLILVQRHRRWAKVTTLGRRLMPTTGFPAPPSHLWWVLFHLWNGTLSQMWWNNRVNGLRDLKPSEEISVLKLQLTQSAGWYCNTVQLKPTALLFSNDNFKGYL